MGFFGGFRVSNLFGVFIGRWKIPGALKLGEFVLFSTVSLHNLMERLDF